MRVFASGAALVGGVCLVANLFTDAGGLLWAGLGLLALAAAATGARLTRRPWLSLVTAGGSVALGWAVLEMIRELAADRQAEALLGGLATLAVAAEVMRQPRRRPHTSGNHRS